MRNLQSAGLALWVVPQNLFESWVVATRPIGVNGLGLSVAEAKSELDSFQSSFAVLNDATALLEEWERLIIAHECKGKAAHDARLVAAMNLHGLKQVPTFNVEDFVRYTGIEVLNPALVASRG
jgi:hypothetical protein